MKNIEYIDPVDSLGILLRNKIVHDKPLTLLRSGEVSQKILIKKKDDYDYKQAA